MTGSKFVRLGLIAGTSFALVSASAASSQGMPWPEGCSQVAWGACSFDENNRPIEVTYECWAYQYQLCLDNPPGGGGGGGGGMAYKSDWSRDAQPVMDDAAV